MAILDRYFYLTRINGCPTLPPMQNFALTSQHNKRMSALQAGLRSCQLEVKEAQFLLSSATLS